MRFVCVFFSLFAAMSSAASEFTLSPARGGDNSGEIIVSESFSDYRFDEKTITHSATTMLAGMLQSNGIDWDPYITHRMNQTVTEQERADMLAVSCEGIALDIRFSKAYAPKGGSGLVFYTANPADLKGEQRARAEQAVIFANAVLRAWRESGRESNGETVHFSNAPTLTASSCPTVLINLDSNLSKDSTWFVQPQSIMYRMRDLAKAIGAAL